MKRSKEVLSWILLFSIFMGLGYLHGFRPQNFERRNFIPPSKVRVLITEEILFPEEVRQHLEKELNVQLEVTLSQNWQDWLANLSANPSVDLLILPSYWAYSLNHQGLLSFYGMESTELISRAAADFLKRTPNNYLSFLPLYWMKTGFANSTGKGTFEAYLKDAKNSSLYLWSDPDVVLAHLRSWKNQGWETLLKTKNIFLLDWDALAARNLDLTPQELPLNENAPPLLEGHRLGALLIWGLAIPQNAANVSRSRAVIELLTRTSTQEIFLLETPFSSALSAVGQKSFPQERRAGYIRNLNLAETLILDSKDVEAEKHLKEEFDFTW